MRPPHRHRRLSDRIDPRMDLVTPSPLVASTLARLETLIGLAPGEVSRRRLERNPNLHTRADHHPLTIDDPAWADVIDAVTIQETRLFRHPAQCLLLHDIVLPDLIEAARKRGADKIRMLCAGCATGEEAWTLAAIADHGLAQYGSLDAGPRLDFEVIALDLSRPALRAAARARYASGPPDPLRDVPPPFRTRFPATPAGVTVSPEFSGKVRFRRGNLLTLRPDQIGFDVITCRNVGIYLTSAARDTVMSSLAAQLVPGGALLVGPTDTVPAETGLRLWHPDTVSVYRRPPAILSS